MRARYSAQHKRVVWDHEPEWGEVTAPRPRANEVHASKPRNFADRSLPKNYKYHKEAGGKFDSEGRCVFDSWSQIERTVAVARANGENLCYDQPFRRIGGLD